MSTSHVAGAIVALTAEYEGQWKMEQLESAHSFAPAGYNDSRVDIDWSHGPTTIRGYVNRETYEISISPTINAVNAGNIYGNLKDGLSLKINLLTTKGEMKIYLKNGNEIWVHPDIKITFDGSYQGDHKIVTI